MSHTRSNAVKSIVFTSVLLLSACSDGLPELDAADDEDDPTPNGTDIAVVDSTSESVPVTTATLAAAAPVEVATDQAVWSTQLVYTNNAIEPSVTEPPPSYPSSTELQTASASAVDQLTGQGTANTSDTLPVQTTTSAIARPTDILEEIVAPAITLPAQVGELEQAEVSTESVEIATATPDPIKSITDSTDADLISELPEIDLIPAGTITSAKDKTTNLDSPGISDTQTPEVAAVEEKTSDIVEQATDPVLAPTAKAAQPDPASTAIDAVTETSAPAEPTSDAIGTAALSEEPTPDSMETATLSEEPTPDSMETATLSEEPTPDSMETATLSEESAPVTIDAPLPPEEPISDRIEASVLSEESATDGTSSDTAPAEIETAVPLPTIELLTPDDFATVTDSEQLGFSWSIPALILGTVGSFDFSIAAASDKVVSFRDTLHASSICNEQGQCSISINSIDIPIPAGDQIWTVAAIDSEIALSEKTGTFTLEKLPQPEEKSGMPIVADEALFVSAQGVDSNDGMTEETPLKSLQTALDKAVAGDTIYVKSGHYKGQKVSITRSGTQEKPITIEGYQLLPGDAPSLGNIDNKTEPDAGVMPFLDGGSRENNDYAFRVSADHIVIKNLQISNYKAGIYASGVNDNLFENIFATALGNPLEHYDGFGIFMGGDSTNSTIKNNVIVNATAQGITVSGSYNSIEGNKVYSDDNSNSYDSNTDYYMTFNEAYHNSITDNYIERVGDLDHGGHGYTVKGPNEYNVFDGNEAVNMSGGAFVARREGARNNIFRNGIIRNGNGILTRNGANNNLFENFEITDASYGIWTLSQLPNPEDMGIIASENNTFRNISIKNAAAAISFRKYKEYELWTRDNIFDGIHIDDANYVFLTYHYSSGNILKNSTIKNVSRWALAGEPATLSALGVSLENVQVLDNRFVLP